MKKEFTMFEDNQDFYPTPKNLADKMIAKIDWAYVKTILEPSAGKGDLIESVETFLKTHYRYGNTQISCIEKDENLQHILWSKGYKLIDSDFIAYEGGLQFDAIIMNPPFSNGDKHLLKAIDMMFSGQIVCLLNAETLKNPYSRSRKDLLERLNELNADVEYLSGEFEEAERKTSVEIALIYINIKRDVETILFDDVKHDAESYNKEEKSSTEICSSNSLEAMVEQYNNLKQRGIEFLEIYYKNKELRRFFPLEGMNDKGNLTNTMKASINSFIHELRSSYWKKMLETDQVSKNLTEKSYTLFQKLIGDYSNMEFSMTNIHTVLRNLSMDFFGQIEDAAEKLFDDITRKYSWSEETDKNRLHYDSWKTNESFKVNSKIILPSFHFYDDIRKSMRVSWQLKLRLDDIDKVMNFFAGYGEYVKMSDVIERSFQDGMSRNLESTFFIISVYKKGTIHLIFKDKDILRKFNVFCGKKKGWLPNYYSNVQYDELSENDKELVKSFDGKDPYIVYPSTQSFLLSFNPMT